MRTGLACMGWTGLRSRSFVTRTAGAVERELLDHLEDKATDLMRIFPGLTREEAEQRALEEMGAAEELGEELARVHSPLVGELWQLTRFLIRAVWWCWQWSACGCSGNLPDRAGQGDGKGGEEMQGRKKQKNELERPLHPAGVRPWAGPAGGGGDPGQHGAG